MLINGSELKCQRRLELILCRPVGISPPQILTDTYIHSFWIRGAYCIYQIIIYFPPRIFRPSNGQYLLSTSFFMHLWEAHNLAKLTCDSPDTLSIEIWALNLECQKLTLELRYSKKWGSFNSHLFNNLLMFDSLYHLFSKCKIQSLTQINGIEHIFH